MVIEEKIDYATTNLNTVKDAMGETLSWFTVSRPSAQTGKSFELSASQRKKMI